jgi:hypothetical protein
LLSRKSQSGRSVSEVKSGANHGGIRRGENRNARRWLVRRRVACLASQAATTKKTSVAGNQRKMPVSLGGAKV